MNDSIQMISHADNSVHNNQLVAVKVSQVTDKTLPENGLATIAQQPDTYTLANKTLQYSLAKNQYQHTQNMIEAYQQDQSNEEEGELYTDLSLTDLYKRAYLQTRTEHIDLEERMTIQPAGDDLQSKLAQRYQQTQIQPQSLLHIQV